MASWVFAQPVGGGRLIRFPLIHTLIGFLVHSALPRPGLAQGLCWALQPVTVVFSSFVSESPPVPGCLLHSAFPGLSCVGQEGLGFTVETNNSEISLGNIKVFPHVLCGWGLFLLHSHIEAHCPVPFGI